MVDMYCFKAELEMLDREMRDTLTLYRQPDGLSHGKLIKVAVEQKQGRSLLG